MTVEQNREKVSIASKIKSNGRHLWRIYLPTKRNAYLSNIYRNVKTLNAS